MVFSSILFLTLFLPVALLLCTAVPPRFRNAAALLASLVFYAWGAPTFVLVLVATSCLDYLLAHALPPDSATPTLPRPPRARAILALGVAVNLAILLYFKYANFFVDQLHALGLDFAWTRVALPIGISFFTFQKISYLVDVFRGDAPPARSFPDYLLYVALFPQLIAGPIVRYGDVAAQIRSRRLASEDLLQGFWRFSLGLAKKVLLANPLAALADWAFALPPADLGPLAAWTGALAYAFQIFFDFAGYSDMAIGLGRMLGFRFRENFDAPYLSPSITDFWRRWHISLGTWMREYLYIPLGGNRRGPARTYFNLWLTFLLSGLWHGAAWNFLVWGAYHGILLTLHRAWRRRPGISASASATPARPGLPDVLAIPATFLLVLIGWVFFRIADAPLSQAFAYLAAMAGLHAATPDVAAAFAAQLANPVLLAAFAGAIATTLLPLWPRTRALRDADVPPAAPFAVAAPRLLLRSALSALLFLLALSGLATGAFNPFIYFRF